MSTSTNTRQLFRASSTSSLKLPLLPTGPASAAAAAVGDGLLLPAWPPGAAAVAAPGGRCCCASLARLASTMVCTAWALPLLPLWCSAPPLCTCCCLPLAPPGSVCTLQPLPPPAADVPCWPFAAEAAAVWLFAAAAPAAVAGAGSGFGGAGMGWLGCHTPAASSRVHSSGVPYHCRSTCWLQSTTQLRCKGQFSC